MAKVQMAKAQMENKTSIFESARPQLLGIAYRLLGSMSDAQDAVQDTYIKWVSHGEPVDVPPAWLSRVCTHRCLDQLKSASHKRVDYVGQWIPEQIQTEFEFNAEESLEMTSSLTTAFLLLLERLTPKERAAYLLHDIFGMPFDEVAGILELQATNCRKLATRARQYVVKNNVRHVPEKQRQKELLTAFQTALHTGDTRELSAMLRVDSNLRADSGGKVPAVRKVLEGGVAICDFINQTLFGAWSEMRIEEKMINGLLGLVVEDEHELHAAISFGYDTDGLVSQIYIMRHPQKLAQFAQSKGLVTEEGGLTLMNLVAGTGANHSRSH